MTPPSPQAVPGTRGSFRRHSVEVEEFAVVAESVDIFATLFVGIAGGVPMVRLNELRDGTIFFQPKFVLGHTID